MAISSNSWSMSKEERAAQNAKLKLYGFHWMKNEKAKWVLIDAQNNNEEIQIGAALAKIDSGKRAKMGPEYNYQDRATAIAWAHTIANRKQVEKPVVILDTETSGLGTDAVVIEVSAVDLCGNIVFDSLINPDGVEIDPEAAQTHGIGMDMLEKAPLFVDVWTDLRRLLSTCEIIIYNQNFDLRLLKQTAASYDLEIPAIVSHCLMRQYAAFFGEIKPAAKPDVQFLSKKLEQACEHFNIPAGGHRALADAEAARRVLLAMAESDIL